MIDFTLPSWRRAARCLPVMALVASGAAIAQTQQADQRQAGRNVNQATKQEARSAKVDCRQENSKSNAECRQDKRSAKQGGRQDKRDIKY